ncbi:MAG: urate hydroxylase PuuD, partial [Gammaproteobacteria bacterium]|nr:urate hydroxylase PuuD [Gammaproteobacteria bacterium]
MENHLHEWAHLLLRWIHFIVGVAWIGASFYFNWLENRLDRRAPRPGVAGDLWAVHGGGFYHLQKFETAPDALPPQLHWFKWEAYTTWLSGFALLVMVYYMNAAAFLLDADAAVELNAWQGVAIGVGALVVSWLAYDALCRSRLRRAPLQLAAVVFACLTALAWALSELLSGRAAYIHTGAAIGSIMVGNVLFVIIPAQNKMVAALTAGRAVDPARGAAALLRSRHNNYLTLPVLFIMVSVHFPATYGHAWNWAILAAIGAAGWLARHYFNVRHLRGRGGVWLLVAGFAILAATAWVTAP